MHSLILREQQHSQFLQVKLQLCSHPALVGAFASLLSIISTYSIRVKYVFITVGVQKKEKIKDRHCFLYYFLPGAVFPTNGELSLPPALWTEI